MEAVATKIAGGSSSSLNYPNSIEAGAVVRPLAALQSPTSKRAKSTPRIDRSIPAASDDRATAAPGSRVADSSLATDVPAPAAPGSQVVGSSGDDVLGSSFLSWMESRGVPGDVVGAVRGLQNLVSETSAGLNRAERMMNEFRADRDQLAKEIRARNIERDDYQNRLAIGQQQVQHLADQIRLLERREEELVRQRDLATAQTAHVVQRTNERDAHARSQVAALESRCASSESALFEIASEAQRGAASSELDRQRFRERAVQALQDKEAIIDALKTQCQLIAEELYSAGSALSVETELRKSLEKAMAEIQNERDMFMHKYSAEVGKGKSAWLMSASAQAELLDKVKSLEEDGC